MMGRQCSDVDRLANTVAGEPIKEKLPTQL